MVPVAAVVGFAIGGNSQTPVISIIGRITRISSQKAVNRTKAVVSPTP